MNILSRASKVS